LGRALGASPAVDQLPHDVETPVVPGDLFDQVQQNPAQIGVPTVTDRTFRRCVQVVLGDQVR
jgi:hypothetical protein